MIKNDDTDNPIVAAAERVADALGYSTDEARFLGTGAVKARSKFCAALTALAAVAESRAVERVRREVSEDAERADKAEARLDQMRSREPNEGYASFLTIERYQKCVRKLFAMFPHDPLPADDQAHLFVERLESLIERKLLVPASRVADDFAPPLASAADEMARGRESLIKAVHVARYLASLLPPMASPEIVEVLQMPVPSPPQTLLAMMKPWKAAEQRLDAEQQLKAAIRRAWPAEQTEIDRTLHNLTSRIIQARKQPVESIDAWLIALEDSVRELKEGLAIHTSDLCGAAQKFFEEDFGKSPRRCQTCGGSGRRNSVFVSGDTITCSDCHGTGKTPVAKVAP